MLLEIYYSDSPTESSSSSLIKTTPKLLWGSPIHSCESIHSIRVNGLVHTINNVFKMNQITVFPYCLSLRFCSIRGVKSCLAKCEIFCQTTTL